MERRGKGAGSGPFVILHGGDDKAPIKIECFFGFLEEDDELPDKRLAKGQVVTVRGEYGGRVSHIQLRGCVLVK